MRVLTTQRLRLTALVAIAAVTTVVSVACTPSDRSEAPSHKPGSTISANQPRPVTEPSAPNPWLANDCAVWLKALGDYGHIYGC